MIQFISLSGSRAYHVPVPLNTSCVYGLFVSAIRSFQVMSLNAENDVILRTADQYELWKCRIHALCWSKTNVSIFEVSSADCLERKEKGKGAKDKDKDYDWIGKCWMLISRSLHNTFRQSGACAGRQY